MSSQWIKIIVWLAYIMADWVATVALGKLSHVQNNIPNPNNELQALWAPLLLLHLGGPDTMENPGSLYTITAYSLEDNQLWIRHLLGMGVQATVAIYVIVMSWRHFLFSFMLIPAFVAGIIKYGDRAWALKLACHDKSRSIVPFYYGHYIIDSLARPIKQEERDEKVLRMAHTLVITFKDYIENYDIGRYEFQQSQAEENFLNPMNLDDATYIGDILEVEMGFMYDLLYTKAPITFTKRGCILRSISFMCTVSMLVGVLRLIAMEVKWSKQHYSMVDIVITGVLLVRALALEIYAKWSKKMGQIDLFEEEDKRSKWSRIRKSLGIQGKFYWGSYISIDLGSLGQLFGSTSFHDQIIIMHIITDIFYRYDDTHTSQNSANSSRRPDDKETCKTLSKYMMYLLHTCRSLFPVVVSDSQLKDFISYVRLCFSVMNTQDGEEGRNPSDMIKNFIEGARSVRFEEGKIEQGAKLRFVEAMDFYKDVIIELVVDKGNKELREGGELLNLVWFLIPQSRILCGVNTFTLNGFFNKYFQSMPDVERARPKNNEGSQKKKIICIGNILFCIFLVVLKN
ncbi:hypothetical protein CsSME_00008215 [Camellia sinensis var. sinensis]